MATQSRGAPYPLGTDANNTAADIQALALWTNDRPGVSPLTTTQINALSGVERWDGRIVLDTTVDRLKRWDAGSTTWITIPDNGDIAALLATSGLPAANALTASRGVSSSAARADHVHPYVESDAAVTPDPNTTTTNTRVYLRGRMATLFFECAPNIAWNNVWTLFVVPAGYRPVKRTFFVAPAAGANYLCQLNPDGGCIVVSGTWPAGTMGYITVTYAVA